MQFYCTSSEQKEKEFIMFGKKHTPKKKRGSAGLNMAIASMHGLNNRLIGLQMTSGNVIGIVVSAIQVTIGALIVAHPSIVFGIILAIVTCALAVLIERLSLGGLGNVRNAVAKWTQLDDAYFEMQQTEQREPTALEAHNYQRKRSIQVWTFIGSLLIVLVGVSISGFVGDQFWLWVWHSAGEPMSTILGISCAVVISLGFVYSELFKKPSDDEIEDRVNDDRIQQAVLKRAETDLQIGLGLEAFGNVRADADKKQQALMRIEEVVQDRLEMFADQMSSFGKSNLVSEEPTLIDAPVNVPLLPEQAEVSHSDEKVSHSQEEEQAEVSHSDEKASHSQEDEQAEVSHSDEKVSHSDEIKTTIVRSYYADHRDVLIEAVTKNPDVSLNELVRLTGGRPRVTVSRWRVKAEQEIALQQAEVSHSDEKVSHSQEDEQAEVSHSDEKVSHSQEDEQAEVFHSDEKVSHSQEDEQAEVPHSDDQENNVAA